MTLYRRESDGLWVGAVEMNRRGDGRRVRKTVAAKTKRQAQLRLRELRKTIDAGLVLGPRDRTTVEQWVRHWLDDIAAPDLRPRTYSTYRSLVDRQIVPAIGQYRLAALTPAHVREMHAANAATGLAPSTVAGAHTVLKAALKAAVADQLIARNVAELVSTPRIGRLDRPALTGEQVRHFMQVAVDAADPMATRWAAAFTLGLRQGEALGLEWDRVLLAAEPMPQLDLSWALSPLPQAHGCGAAATGGDFPCGKARPASCPDAVYRVPRTYPHRRLRGSLALVPPKTTGSVRRVPLLTPMARMLAHHRESTPTNAYGLVWADDRGMPIHPSRDAAAWYAALDRAGLPRVPLHTARHTTATLLLGAGVDMHVIAQVLGHTSTVTTELYAHVDKTLAAAALAPLAELLPA